VREQQTRGPTCQGSVAAGDGNSDTPRLNAGTPCGHSTAARMRVPCGHARRWRSALNCRPQAALARHVSGVDNSEGLLSVGKRRLLGQVLSQRSSLLELYLSLSLSALLRCVYRPMSKLGNVMIRLVKLFLTPLV
jgi:hypothetical protein